MWWGIIGNLVLASVGMAQQATGLPELRVPDGFGVNIHFTVADAKELELLRAAGVKFIRMDFGWGGIERRKGEYDFLAYDRLVADMGKLGIRCLLILDYSNRLYDNGLSPHTEESRAAFARWAAAGAKHFAGKGVLWEIWNEPNISQFWKPRPNAEDYSKLALATIEAIRAADRDAFIMAPASSTFPWDFFEVMGKQGVFAKLDAVSVHPYRQQTPETAEADYTRLRLLVEKYAPGKKLPIVSGEWGYSTGWGGMTDEKQANYLVRQRLMNLWMGVPLSIWYDWHDDGPDPKEPEHHFGTVYLDFKPKPSYTAGKVLAETLAGYRCVRREQVKGEDDYMLVFRKGDDAAFVVWNSKQDHTITLRDDLGAFTLISRDGQRKQIPPGSELELNAAPQYFLMDRVKAGLFGCWGPAGTMIVVKDGRASVQVAFEPPSGRGMKGRLEVTVGPDDTVIGKVSADVAAGKKQTIAVPVNFARRDRRATLAMVHFLVEDSTENFSSPIWLLSPDPLGVSVLPIVDGNIAVLVDNPSGQAADLQMRIKSDTLLGSPRLKLGGNTSGMVAFGVFDKLADDAAIRVDVTDPEGQLVAQPDLVRWRKTAMLAADWRAGVSGDAKVAGSAKASVVDLTEPPQPGLKNAIQVDYQFATGWKYAPIRIAKEGAAIEGKPAIVGMWVFGNASGDVLRCTVRDSTGQTFQHTYGPVTWTGWKWITMPLDGADAGHWDGANDGVMHYPIQWESPMLIDGMRLKVDQPLQIRATGFAVGYPQPMR